MVRFCFKSFAQPGHYDFGGGGMSYVSAQMIIRNSGLTFKEFDGLHTRSKNVVE